MGNLQELSMHTGNNTVRHLYGPGDTVCVYAIGRSEPEAVATGKIMSEPEAVATGFR